MEMVWSVFCGANSDEAARKVAKWFQQRLEREILDLALEPYPKTGGWTFTARTPLVGTAWNDQVVEAISLGQQIGYAWRLSGEVESSLSGWSNELKVSGITAIEWQLWRDAPADH
jgi:hypothetical protein